jgi:P27 family predicted phage terminase small subunit
MKGRKPTPTYLKLVTGNPGRRPLKARAEPQGGVPRPPAVLGADAVAEWRRVAVKLSRLGLLATIDRAALAAYCQAYGRWVAAERALALMAERDPVTAGLLIKTSNGNAIQNPLVGIANKAAAAMVRYAAEFGMTPSARSRVEGAPEGRNGDAAAAKYF